MGRVEELPMVVELVMEVVSKRRVDLPLDLSRRPAWKQWLVRDRGGETSMRLELR